MKKGKSILIASSAILSVVALSSAIGVSMALVMSADEVPQLAMQKRCIYLNVADSPAWQNYSGQKIAAYVWKYNDENVQAGFVGGLFGGSDARPVFVRLGGGEDLGLDGPPHRFGQGIADEHGVARHHELIIEIRDRFNKKLVA